MIRSWKVRHLFIFISTWYLPCLGFLLSSQNYGFLNAKLLPQQQQQQQQKHLLHLFNNDHASDSDVQFLSPLLEYGYPIAVQEYENDTMIEKPLLLYLPGLDGTFLCPFIQFPELNSIFDVRSMIVGTSDRSTLEQLTLRVLQYLLDETTITTATTTISTHDSTCSGYDDSTSCTSTSTTTTTTSRQTKKEKRPVYLMGESFGGILTCHVAHYLSTHPDWLQHKNKIQLEGIILINPATCYTKSSLAKQGPPITKLPWWQYPMGLWELLPLFTDDYSWKQLRMILRAQALPSVLNNAMREAYMGRVAFSLPWIVPIVTPATLEWRFQNWLKYGSSTITTTELFQIQSNYPTLRTLLVAGEKDATLPSVEEVQRLSQLLPNPQIHIVPGAGHASTCGSRVDLAALIRYHFRLYNGNDDQNKIEVDKEEDRKDRTENQLVAAVDNEIWHGMQKRYDSAPIGLNPLLYWSKPYYQKHEKKV